MNSLYMPIERVADFLKDVEGLELKPYNDKFGNLTIGYGRNLKDKGISKKEADILLYNDIEDSVKDLVEIFNDFFDLPSNIQIVLISMIFNLGRDGFLEFKKFIEAVKKRDYKKASFELLNSKRAFQIPLRVEKERSLIEDIIKRGIK